MYICTVVKGRVQSPETERNKYGFKRELNDDIDEAHLTSFGTEFQTEKRQKNKRSPNVALL